LVQQLGVMTPVICWLSPHVSRRRRWSLARDSRMRPRGPSPRLAGLVCREPPGNARMQAASVTAATSGSFAWLIRASWLIQGTPVPVINRRTRINHGNGTCGINGADEATPGGDHTPATASMTSRRTGPAGQSCCAPLSGPGCHPPCAALPGMWCRCGGGRLPVHRGSQGRHPRQVNPRVHLVLAR
jgi:hypothetical protein